MSTEGNVKEKDVLQGEVRIPDKIHGLSAYEIAVIHGESRTEEEWAKSLNGNMETEALRVTAEEGRVKAENARAEAENARVSAEEKRVKAESAREKAFNEAKASFDDERAKAVEEFEAESYELVTSEILPNAKTALVDATSETVTQTVNTAKSTLDEFTEAQKDEIDNASANAVSAVESAAASLDTREDLLWENDDVSVARTNGFSVDLSAYIADYKAFRFEFVTGAMPLSIGDVIDDSEYPADLIMPSVVLRLGEKGFIDGGHNATSSSYYAIRAFYLQSSGVVVFSGVTNLSGVSNADKYNIPYRIYGLKDEKVNIPVPAYSTDADGNVTFPAKITATEFVGKVPEAAEAKVTAEEALSTASAANSTASAANSNAEKALNATKKAANALIGTASGEMLKAGDVSPVEHTFGVRVKSRNIISQSDIVTTSAELNGLTVSYLEDEDCFLINGTATETASHCLTQLNLPAKKNYAYTMTTRYVSGEVDAPTGVYAVAYLGSNDTLGKNTNWFDVSLKNEDVSETHVLTRNYISAFGFYISAGATFTDYKVKIQLEEGSSASEYTPYVEPSSVTLTKYGKNLYDFYAEGIMSQQGVTECVVDGYSITAKGNEGSVQYSYDAGQLLFPYTSAAIIKEKGFAAKKGITYTISFDALLHEIGKYSDRIQILVYYSDLSMVHNQYGLQLELGVNKRYSFSFTPAKDDRIEVTFRLNNNYITFSNIQIEAGASANGYEPYVESVTYTPSEDGTVEGVTSVYPTTTLISDTEGVVIECEYNKDANKVIASLEERIAALEALVVSQ